MMINKDEIYEKDKDGMMIKINERSNESKVYVFRLKTNLNIMKYPMYRTLFSKTMYMFYINKN